MSRTPIDPVSKDFPGDRGRPDRTRRRPADGNNPASNKLITISVMFNAQGPAHAKPSPKNPFCVKY
jgi:hypothetical protein